MRKLEQNFHGFAPFHLMVQYAETDASSPDNTFDSHTHHECELYVNVSGDVSFMVEGRLYPVSHGDVVVSRPYEYHRCIYRSDRPHRHFWILFTATDGEPLLDFLLRRPDGAGSLIALPPAGQETLIQTCFDLLEQKTDSGRYACFFRLLALLESGRDVRQCDLPPDVENALRVIHADASKIPTVQELARQSHVSVNTLERHFSETVQLSPREYIRQKRLSVAAGLLLRGANVGEAAERCGFSDYSSFIKQFRKHFGQTPLQYRKQSARLR